MRGEVGELDRGEDGGALTQHNSRELSAEEKDTCAASRRITQHTLFFLTRENSLSFSTSFLCCLACLVTASGLGCRAYQRYALGVETRIRQKRTQQGRYTHKKLLRSLFTRSIARTIFTRLFVYDTQVHAAIMCATGYSQ